MYCRKCGLQNEDNAYRCIQCGATLDRIDAAVAPVQRIPNYLAHSILTTPFCCVPFGIVAIVYAAQVNGKLVAGDIQGAMTASRQAKMWASISFGIGCAWVLVCGLCHVVMMIIAAAAGGLE